MAGLYKAREIAATINTLLQEASVQKNTPSQPNSRFQTQNYRSTPAAAETHQEAFINKHRAKPQVRGNNSGRAGKSK